MTTAPGFNWTPAKFLSTLSRAVNAGMTSASIQAQANIKSSMVKNGRYTPSAAGRPPNSRRGTLSNRIRAIPSRNFRSGVASGVAYGRIHELGGIIRAKKGALPVPLNVAAQIMLETSPGGLRSQNLVLIHSKRGNKVLISRENVKSRRGGMRTDARAAFVLRKTVRMPPRPYLMPGVFLPANAQKIVQAAALSAQQVMTRAIGGAR